MTKIKPKTLAGFQDLLPEQCTQQNRLIDQLKDVFTSFGFAPIYTPHIELTEMLISETGGEIGKQLYRFEDQGGRDVCLRFDLTVPLARYVVQHKNDLGLPFKRYAIGACFRGERPQHGRLREFMQCDFDILGTSSLAADAEILQVIASGLQKIGIKNFKIKVNSRKLLNSFIESLGLADRAVDLIRLFDKREKIEEAKFLEGLEQIGCSSDQSEQIQNFMAISANGKTNADVLAGLQDLGISNDSFKAAMAEVQELDRLISELAFVREHMQFDLTLARGFGYYTGCLFEAVIPDMPEVGSIAGGGRYDNLTKTFSKDEIPGVGASFGISRILVALEKMEAQSAKTLTDVLVTNLDAEYTPQINSLASSLRAENVNVEVYPDVTKLKKQIQYADKKGIKYLLICGPEEFENGAFQVKDLQSGDQVACKDASEIISKLAS